jgi:hypothetical protein
LPRLLGEFSREHPRVHPTMDIVASSSFCLRSKSISFWASTA